MDDCLNDGEWYDGSYGDGGDWQSEEEEDQDEGMSIAAIVAASEKRLAKGELRAQQ